MELVKKYLPIAVIVFIFGQSFPFKFGLVDSITTDHIFNSVGDFLGLDFYKEHGGLITGILELAAVSLLALQNTRGLGGALALALMTGAIFFHLTAIGISVPVQVACPETILGQASDAVGLACTEDDPSLFVMAIIAWVCAAIVTLRHKDSLPVIGAAQKG